MLRILAPTDFSTDGYNATLVAMRLAQRFDGEVIFIHAMANPPVPAASPEDLFKTLYQEEERKNQDKLREECNHLFDILDLRRGEVRYKTLVVPTPFAESMLRVIISENIDLVVMGSRGDNSLMKLILGSNTVQLMRLTPVPLLVIPADVVFEGFDSITILLEQKKIAYRPGIDLLQRLARAYDATLHYLILTNDGKIVDGIAELCEQPERWQYLLAMSHTVSTIAESDAFVYLQQHIELSGTKLLVFMLDRRSAWEEFFNRNVTQELALQAKLPFLVLPPIS